MPVSPHESDEEDIDEDVDYDDVGSLSVHPGAGGITDLSLFTGAVDYTVQEIR